MENEEVIEMEDNKEIEDENEYLTKKISGTGHEQ